MYGEFITPRCSLSSGFVSVWQVSQSIPSSSPAASPEPSVGVERPAYQPAALWQRMHRSPEPSKSCSAIATVAQKIGSLPALPIAAPRHPVAGSYSGFVAS
jgi:hypothetical protein